MKETTRREFLASGLRWWATGVAAASPMGSMGSTLEAAFAALASREPGIPGGELLGTLPFLNEGDAAVGRVVGRGLGGRLALDLSQLGPDRLITPTEKFFIRTRTPTGLNPDQPWRIRIRGLVRRPGELSLEDLLPLAEPEGAHLLECSGNSARRRFGLMSVAHWTGIPVTRLLEKIPADPRATRVLINGYDRHPQPHPGSVPGASWIFTFDELARARAFLATGMNGEPLPPDHGRPLRLMVPGWYGCCAIKWVDEIRLVDESAPATSQMREFATRTHQTGVPDLARDYRPATLDLAALPVRVEKWRVEGGVVYRVVGILWGGSRTTRALAIRFNPGEPYQPVERYNHQTTAIWTLFFHTWRPAAPGRYRIRLRVDDPAIPTRRLDMGYYERTVQVDEGAKIS